MPPFVIFSLPRSRSTWLSAFLSYGEWFCGHDELRHMRQIEDIRSWFSQPCTGTVETGAAPFWRLAKHIAPELRIVTIRRDPVEAAKSAVRCGLSPDLDFTTQVFRRLDHKLGQIEHRTGCRAYHYEDLAQEDTCADLFEHLLPYHHDSAWWRRLDGTSVQTPIAPLKRYVAANIVQIDRLAAIAKQKSLALLRARRVREIGGLTLGFEPLSNFPAGELMMREHASEVGEHPDNWARKNLRRLQEIEAAGGLQLTVARSNGRVFGYLVTLIGESLEVEGRLSACHTAFYASPDYPGLGLKLQRKAAEGLRERSVYEVVLHAGVRGAGERLSTLYRRLGAEQFGSCYRLQLGEAA